MPPCATNDRDTNDGICQTCHGSGFKYVFDRPSRWATNSPFTRNIVRNRTVTVTQASLSELTVELNYSLMNDWLRVQVGLASGLRDSGSDRVMTHWLCSIRGHQWWWRVNSDHWKHDDDGIMVRQQGVHGDVAPGYHLHLLIHWHIPYTFHTSYFIHISYYYWKSWFSFRVRFSHDGTCQCGHGLADHVASSKLKVESYWWYHHESSSLFMRHVCHR